MPKQRWETISITICLVVGFAGAIAWAYRAGPEVVLKVGIVTFGLLIGSALLSFVVRVTPIVRISLISEGIACLMAGLIGIFVGLAGSDFQHLWLYLAGILIYGVIELVIITRISRLPASPPPSSRATPEHMGDER